MWARDTRTPCNSGRISRLEIISGVKGDPVDDGAWDMRRAGLCRIILLLVWGEVVVVLREDGPQHGLVFLAGGGRGRWLLVEGKFGYRTPGPVAAMPHESLGFEEGGGGIRTGRNICCRRRRLYRHRRPIWSDQRRLSLVQRGLLECLWRARGIDGRMHPVLRCSPSLPRG